MQIQFFKIISSNKSSNSRICKLQCNIDVFVESKSKFFVIKTSSIKIRIKILKNFMLNSKFFIGFGIRKIENLVRASIVVILMMNLVN